MKGKQCERDGELSRLMKLTSKRKISKSGINSRGLRPWRCLTPVPERLQGPLLREQPGLTDEDRICMQWNYCVKQQLENELHSRNYRSHYLGIFAN